MINRLLSLVKKFVSAALLIYAFDSLIFIKGHIIAINLLTVSIIGVFGFVGMFFLIIFSFF